MNKLYEFEDFNLYAEPFKHVLQLRRHKPIKTIKSGNKLINTLHLLTYVLENETAM